MESIIWLIAGMVFGAVALIFELKTKIYFGLNAVIHYVFDIAIFIVCLTFLILQLN